MTLFVRSLVATLLFPSILLLFSCSTPSLVEIARRRQATADGEQRGNARDDVRVRYDITDWDVLNYTDEVSWLTAQTFMPACDTDLPPVRSASLLWLAQP
jgi:hypothetical protein